MVILSITPKRSGPNFEIMKTCITCGMPFEGSHEGDIGFESADGPVCKYDSENGVMKSPEVIYEGGIQFFMGEPINAERELAERLTRSNMSQLPYWQAHHFVLLDGEMATDEEFGAAMAKLS